MLTSKERKALRGQAQRLEATVFIGSAGPGAAQVDTLENQLTRTPLVKVQLRHDDRAVRQAWAEQLLTASGAELVGTIGKYAILYRPRPEVSEA